MSDILIKDKVQIIFDGYLPGNNIRPPLKENEEYDVIDTHVCGCGELHINIGLISNYNYVSCYKCEEHLPNSENIHWCHSSRFKKLS